MAFQGEGVALDVVATSPQQGVRQNHGMTLGCKILSEEARALAVGQVRRRLGTLSAETAQ